eukprot:scaffold97236_cov20-Tisochrysis_lutea.AAC.1
MDLESSICQAVACFNFNPVCDPARSTTEHVSGLQLKPNQPPSCAPLVQWEGAWKSPSLTRY